MIILSGVLIIGGEISSDYDNISTVELWAPGSDGVQCRLPNMPVLIGSRPSLDSILVGGNDSHRFTIACDSGTCLKFSKGKSGNCIESMEQGMGILVLCSTLTLVMATSYLLEGPR